MIQVRRNLFETNSSSCHSIVVSSMDRGASYDLPIDKTGTLKIYFNTYGWGPDILKTPYEKICYLVTDQIISSTKFMTPVNRFKILKQEKIDSKLSNIKSVIKKNCPRVKNVKFILNNDYYDVFGVIDHQSIGITKNIKDEELEKFIFDNKYIIVIDNDNNYYFEDCCDTEELFEIYDKGKFLEDLIKKNYEKYKY